MHDTDDIGSNNSGNPQLWDMIEARIERRSFLGGTLAVAAGSFFGSTALASTRVSANPGTVPPPRLGFSPIEPSTDDAIRLPEGYTYQILAPWGTPLLAGAPEFAENASNTAADQAKQVGFNHDGTHYFPLPKFGNSRGLLVMNHEYTDANQIYSATEGKTITNDAAGREKVAKALAAHGVSVIAIAKGRDGKWGVVKGDPYNRRITGTTPMLFSGPVSASHPLLESGVTPSPIGTLNNCAHGVTPWGTYLACEENWNGYFGTDDASWTATALEALWRKPLRLRLRVAQSRGAVRPREEPQRVEPLRLGGGVRSVRPALGAGQAHRTRPHQARRCHLHREQGPYRGLQRRRREW